MSNRIKSNIMYNVLVQFATTVLPLISEPYISRVLGTEGIGIHNYSYSITQYFIVLGSLGVDMYGNRQIAYYRDDKRELSNIFWSIFSLKFITLSFFTVIYYLIFGQMEHLHMAFLMQGSCIIIAVLDISWLYMGLEQFKKTAIRSIAIKIMFICLMFVFVKNRGDVYVYIGLNALSLFGGNIILWIPVNQYVDKSKVHIHDITKHVIPAIQLFIPQIAIQLYVLLDKSVLGWLSDVEQVGLYSQAEKIVKSCLAVSSAVGTAMLPRMSYIFMKRDVALLKKYLNLSINSLACLTVAIAFGIAGVSKELAAWFLGEDFREAAILIQMLAPIVILMSLSNVLGKQLLIPTQKHRAFTIAVTCGAVLNFIVNVLLIPRYDAVGACIGTFVAEFAVFVIEFLCAREYIEVMKFLKNLSKYLVIGLCMYLICHIISVHMDGMNQVLINAVQVIAGMTFYIGILVITKDENLLAVAGRGK